LGALRPSASGAAELKRWLRHEVAVRAVSMQGSGVIPPVPPGGPTGLNQERPGQCAEAGFPAGTRPRG
jgi:hypothetical protein